MPSTRLIGLSNTTPILLFFVALLTLPQPSFAADTTTKETFSQTAQPGVRKQSLLSLVFGSTIPLPTERGILLIDAFHDLNGNGLPDQGEVEILNDIKCRVGDYEFNIPAFIPGLSYNETYTISCAGTLFDPELPKDSISVERRGEIYRLSLPGSLAASRKKP